MENSAEKAVAPGKPTSFDSDSIWSQIPRKELDNLWPRISADVYSSETMAKLFRKDFKEMDKDGNGFVSKDELLAANTREAPYPDRMMMWSVGTLYQDLSNLSNDEWGRETSGISSADMEAFDAMRKNVESGADKTQSSTNL